MLEAADKTRVAKSINDLGRRVTAADVATKTGLPVLLVSQALNQIAAETSGRIAVSQNGDLIYSFSLGFSNTYIAGGLKQSLQNAGQKIFKLIYFPLKISFGIVLLFSFFVVMFFLLLFLNFFSGHRGQSRNKKRSDSSKLDFTDHSYAMFRDAFQELTKPAKPVAVRYDYNKPTIRRRSKSNFLLDCFSFLFGDGDPNDGLPEKRWTLIAKVIKQHDNVITAEQLAPYTGAAPDDEDAMLPVLVRFNGKPEVTESGNIIYTFPDLATTAGTDHSEEAPDFLQEFHLNFAEVDENALKPIYTVAAINFFGSWFLYLLLHSKAAPSITSLLMTLAIYATLFLAVPLFRSFWIDTVNKRIDKRNTQRSGWADSLLEPNAKLKEKIEESREYRLRGQSLGSIVYTTEKNNLDQVSEITLKFRPGDPIDAKPEETFDASPTD